MQRVITKIYTQNHIFELAGESLTQNINVGYVVLVQDDPLLILTIKPTLAETINERSIYALPSCLDGLYEKVIVSFIEPAQYGYDGEPMFNVSVKFPVGSIYKLSDKLNSVKPFFFSHDMDSNTVAVYHPQSTKYIESLRDLLIHHHTYDVTRFGELSVDITPYNDSEADEDLIPDSGFDLNTKSSLHQKIQYNIVDKLSKFTGSVFQLLYKK